MLVKLLIIVIIAAIVVYTIRRTARSPRLKHYAKTALPWLLSPALFPLIKRITMLLLRILFRR